MSNTMYLFCVTAMDCSASSSELNIFTRASVVPPRQSTLVADIGLQQWTLKIRTLVPLERQSRRLVYGRSIFDELYTGKLRDNTPPYELLVARYDQAVARALRDGGFPDVATDFKLGDDYEIVGYGDVDEEDEEDEHEA